MGRRGGARPGAGRPPKEPGQKRMVLSTTVSQQCWTDVHLYAESHGRSVSEVVEALLTMGCQQAPFNEFYTGWYASRTPSETFESLRGRRARPVNAPATSAE